MSESKRVRRKRVLGKRSEQKECRSKEKGIDRRHKRGRQDKVREEGSTE